MGKRMDGEGEVNEQSRRSENQAGYLAVEILVWNLERPLAERSDSFYALIASLHGFDLKNRKPPKARIKIIDERS